MLHSLITRSHNLHGRLLFPRLAWSRGRIPSVRLRKQLSALGIGASIAFAIYHESSLTYNDSDELDRTALKSSTPSNPNLSLAFEQDMLIPDLTDNGIYRVDVAALAANNSIEDTYSLYTATFSPTLRFTFFGVFDGHEGWSTARKLAADLSEVVCLHLADVYSKSASTSPEHHRGETSYVWPSPDKIHSAVKAAFTEVDDAIVHEATRQALGLSSETYHALNEGRESTESDPASNTQPMPRLEGTKLLKHAYAGSCAILGIYNNLERTLHVAVTGDSRAVLGRRVLVPPKNAPEGETGSVKQLSATDDTGKYAYQVHQLSLDQNAQNPKEAERLTALHPDEPELLEDGLVLGWSIARAFGDGVMKWSAAIQNRLSQGSFLGNRPRDVIKTPPYFTAEPEVTTFEGVRKGDFLVLASDGLWDSLTNEEVVGLVGKWLEERGSKENIRFSEEDTQVIMPNKVYPSTTIRLPRKDKMHSENSTGIQTKEQTYGPSELPVIFPADYNDNTSMYTHWRTEKQFISVAEDETNVARHLIRNAMGGADRGLSEVLQTMEGKRKRKFSDDITIQVIFFD